MNKNLKINKDSAMFMFRFIGDVWNLLPAKDKIILSNFWAGLVKITGDLQNTAYELDLSVSVNDIPIYNNERWIPYTLDTTTSIDPSPSTDENFKYSFFLGDSRIVSIPTLQDRIDDPSHILVEETDYIVENNMIHFYTPPDYAFFDSEKHILWAKDTFVNNETPYKNFGAFIDFYQENSKQYLNIIQSIWYAYWMGPKLKNIRTSLYLLFGLPTAPYDGTVTDEYVDDSGTKFIVITNLDDTEDTTMKLPSGLNYIVQIGEKVERFQPLCNGIEVIDKITDPNFVQTEIGRQGIQQYLTENATTGIGDTDETKALTLLKEHLWIPQINAETFIAVMDIPNIKNFLQNIKPSYTNFVFQILSVLEDYISFDDRINSEDIDIDLTVNIDNTPVNYLTDDDLQSYCNDGNNSLDIDMDSFYCTEHTSVEVRQGDTLIDSFELTT